MIFVWLHFMMISKPFKGQNLQLPEDGQMAVTSLVAFQHEMTKNAHVDYKNDNVKTGTI